MANNTNLCIISGNLTADPDLQYLPSGVAVAKYTIASNRTWKEKDSGDKREETAWCRCVSYGALAEFMGEWARKGAKLIARGRYTTREYEDKDGQKRTWHEFVIETVELLDWPEKNDTPSADRSSNNDRSRNNSDDNSQGGSGQRRGGSGASRPPSRTSKAPPQRRGQQPDDLDDDIPF